MVGKKKEKEEEKKTPGHTRTNLTQNGEPQRSCLGTQKKKQNQYQFDPTLLELRKDNLYVSILHTAQTILNAAIMTSGLLSVTFFGWVFASVSHGTGDYAGTSFSPAVWWAYIYICVFTEELT